MCKGMLIFCIKIIIGIDFLTCCKNKQFKIQRLKSAENDT